MTYHSPERSYFCRELDPPCAHLRLSSMIYPTLLFCIVVAHEVLYCSVVTPFHPARSKGYVVTAVPWCMAQQHKCYCLGFQLVITLHVPRATW